MEDSKVDGCSLEESKRKEIVELISKRDLGEYEEASHRVIFTFQNYNEKRTITGSDR